MTLDTKKSTYDHERMMTTNTLEFIIKVKMVRANLYFLFKSQATPKYTVLLTRDYVTSYCNLKTEIITWSLFQLRKEVDAVSANDDSSQTTNNYMNHKCSENIRLQLPIPLFQQHPSVLIIPAIEKTFLFRLGALDFVSNTIENVQLRRKI